MWFCNDYNIILISTMSPSPLPSNLCIRLHASRDLHLIEILILLWFLTVISRWWDNYIMKKMVWFLKIMRIKSQCWDDYLNNISTKIIIFFSPLFLQGCFTRSNAHFFRNVLITFNNITLTPERWPVQSQSDLLAIKQLHWSSWSWGPYTRAPQWW